ncbi:VOC family protein [Bacillus sp. S/N-304-OC-R1]|uniref:VOC family protein n=1 Tax=Bacillus sp. S/N-304-OC-R1 TaxID=2758034 RepID=UPI001C8D03A2|nr:VOC family protein [Bacillus sp. S/N-304-OC-R1]MBY0121547.1 VOC family protein [Bacillus sp. S/N-304-OC-R1]
MNFHREPITFVGQVNLKVQNLERSLAFYQKVIGFNVLDKSERSAKLTADGKTVLLSIEQPINNAPKQVRTTGLYHFALLLPKRSDLAKIVQYFAEIGFQFGSSDHLVSEALYLSDPDGNGIEIYTDRDPSDWSWENGEVEMTVDPLNFPDLLSFGRQQSWKGLPAETVMGHIHLHVSELRKSEEFYVKGLGFEVVNRYGSQALFLSDGKYHHHIAINTWNGVGAPAPAPNCAGLESYTLMLPSEEKRAKIVDQLKSIGASISVSNDSFITSDPSSNRIILKV